MVNPKLTRTITIQRERDFGAGGVLKIMLSEKDVSLASQTVAFMELCKDADDMMDMYMKANPALDIVGRGAVGDTGRIVPTTTTERIIATRIDVTMKGGKRLYKVKGGRYSEHGINFFPEHMKANGINPKMIPDEGYTFKGETWMIVEFEGGQPKRVIKLEKADV